MVLPAGHGTLFLGAYIGFSEILQTGVTGKIPRFIAVQPANCSPVYSRWKGIDNPGSSETLAEGIAITEPVRIDDIIDALNKTGGDVIAVTEDEIRKTLIELAGRGFYAEPTSAAVIAGAEKFLKEAEEKGDDPGKTVTVLTGSGLKASEKIYKLLKGSVEK